MSLDWTDLVIAVPCVLLLLVFVFKIGGWKHVLDHILEHGHEVKK